MQDFRPLLIAMTFAFLGSAFYLTYRPRGDSSGGRAKMMKVNKVMLWVVTGLAIVFLFFPQALSDLLASDDEFTPEMRQTVVSIEGMT